MKQIKILEEFPATNAVLICRDEYVWANKEIEWLNILYDCGLHKWTGYKEATRFHDFLYSVKKHNSDEFSTEDEMYEFARNYIRLTTSAGA